MKSFFMPCRRRAEPSDARNVASSSAVRPGIAASFAARNGERDDAVDLERVEQRRQGITLFGEGAPRRERGSQVSGPARRDDPKTVQAQILARHEPLVPAPGGAVDGEHRLAVPALGTLNRS
ncbi:hypothetical protein [Microterricola pindariensis]|uniref:hypothetical protein n=1 Tax=Microterricola pindariensis TaxID=478010 RepID=UPI0010573B1C|nr:hypothetical protein [Microterricola pindariensis]